MTLIEDLRPSPAEQPNRPKRRWVLGLLLVVVGIGLPASVQWSISALADELATEIQLGPDQFQVTVSTTNLPIGSRPLATADIRSRFSGDDPLLLLRTLLRDQGFELQRADPESWVRERREGNDATSWTIETRAGTRKPTLHVEMRTLDDDGRLVFPISLLLGFALILGGVAVLGGSQSRSYARAGSASAGALLLSMIVTIYVQALRQGKSLLASFERTHGRPPGKVGPNALDSDYDLASTALECQLGAVRGLWWNMGGLAAATALLSFALADLMPTAGARRTMHRVVALGFCAIFVAYSESTLTIVNLLE